MKSTLICTFLVGLLTLPASAQVGGRRSPGLPRPLPTPPSSLPNPAGWFISGTVVIDDGTRLTESAAIQTVCQGQKHTETRTDSHGGFSFQLGGRTAATSADAVGDADSGPISTQGRAIQTNWQNCELQAVLAGFTSETLDLAARISTMDTSDIGRIVLHRLSHVEGLTVSATSAMAPDRARKAYAKGLKQERQSKWEAAENSFRQAVEIYSRYAVAWLELGRVQLHNNDEPGARQSFQRSLDADSRFVSPAQELAMMAARGQRWQEAADICARVIALNPLLPLVWYLNAAADFNLQKLDEAEKSVREGIRLDEGRRIPRMQYLLARILMEKQDYPQAAEHMRAYLQSSPKAQDADIARRQLADIERQSAAASAADPAAPK